MTTYEKARLFIGRNARPLDMARWQYHFENGSQSAVMAALAAYQNADGGFGHGLEPDAWNPNSSPIQTWTATEILKEISFVDSTHPVIQGILRYLASGQDFDGHFWQNTVCSNNDYPHAPWWHTESSSSCHNGYNPSACLAGFIIRFADRGAALYPLGCRIAKEACHAYIEQGLLNDMHTAACYIRLLEYCREAAVLDLFDISALTEQLRRQVRHSITQNMADWDVHYGCKPSQFFNAKSSLFYLDNQATADYECQHIANTQLEDGSWNIPWNWNGYPEQWAIAKNWWKSNGILVNLLYLAGMGCLPGEGNC